MSVIARERVETVVTVRDVLHRAASSRGVNEAVRWLGREGRA